MNILLIFALACVAAYFTHRYVAADPVNVRYVPDWLNTRRLVYAGIGAVALIAMVVTS